MALSGDVLLLLSFVLSAVWAQEQVSSTSSSDLLSLVQISGSHFDSQYTPEAGNVDYRCHTDPEDCDATPANKVLDHDGMKAMTLPTQATSAETPPLSSKRYVTMPSSSTLPTPESWSVRHRHRPTSSLPLRSIHLYLNDLDAHLCSIATNYWVVMIVAVAIAGLLVYRHLRRNRFCFVYSTDTPLV